MIPYQCILSYLARRDLNADSVPLLQPKSMVSCETEDGQFDPETDQFHNLFEFLKQGLSIFFTEFQSTQVHLKFYPDAIRQHAGKLNA